MIPRLQCVSRRLQRQKGQEMLTFALVLAFVFVPLLLWLFVIGMGLITSIQVNTLARDMDNMYIHGTDFSTYGGQQLAQQIATGLGLQFPTFGTGNTNQATNEGSSGNGIIWVTQIMYVGAASGADSNTCQSIAPTACTNANSFVYTQQIIFGNSTLTTQKNTTLGTYAGPQCPASPSNPPNCITSGGVITNPLTDSNAQLASTYQTAMDNQWQTTSNGQASLQDGQIVYVVECYFQTPGLTFGSVSWPYSGNYNTQGVYARYFF